jgi:hypothetical protein
MGKYHNGFWGYRYNVQVEWESQCCGKCLAGRSPGSPALCGFPAWETFKTLKSGKIMPEI